MTGVQTCALPISITSGHTAFRSARLTIADWFKIDQTKIPKRLMLAVPLLGIGYLISLIDYSVVWRYFSWSNQTLAMIVLWAGSVYLAKYAKVAKPASSLIAALPATFMSAVSCTYILYAEEGFKLSTTIAYPIGIIFAAVCLCLFLFKTFIPALKEKANY